MNNNCKAGHVSDSIYGMLSIHCDTKIVQDYKKSVKFNEKIKFAFEHYKTANDLLQKAMKIAIVGTPGRDAINSLQGFFVSYKEVKGDMSKELEAIKKVKSQFKNIDIKTEALSKAFKVKYEDKIDEISEVAGTPFGKSNADHILDITKNGDTESIIDFDKFFGITTTVVKHKVYNSKLHGKHQSAFHDIKLKTMAALKKI